MPQAGMHGLVGLSVKKFSANKEWVLLGILLGNMFPDTDNLAVAVATLSKMDTHGLHRTFTHSVFTILLAYLLFWGIGKIKQQPKWTNFAAGFALGIAMHILLDFVIWFNGVNLFWPFGGMINFWAGVTAPAWLDKFLNPAEFLFLGLFLYSLRYFALKNNTDKAFIKMLNIWIILEAILFIVFTPLAYIMTTGFLSIFGGLYLFSLFLAIGVTIRMRETVAGIG